MMKFRYVLAAVAVTVVSSMGIASIAAAAPESGKDPAGKPIPGLSSYLQQSVAAPENAPSGMQQSLSSLVDVQITSRDIDATVAALVLSGAPDYAVIGDSLLASVYASTLTNLAGDPSVVMINPAPIPSPTVTGQYVGVTNADDWHAKGGTGAGVTIAIIDGGFAGYSSLLGTELPSPVWSANYCSLPVTSVHGTAVAEVVHDMAPNASLMTYCVDSALDLANASQDAINRGADIITQSLVWVDPENGGDGTGLFHTIAEQARAAGVLWVNSAGNDALSHWRGAANTSGGDETWHRWNGSDIGQSITLAPNQSITVILRWDEYPEADTDFDLFLFEDSTSTNPNLADAVSVTEQSGDDPPFEILDYTNGNSARTVHIEVQRWSGSASPDLDLIVWGLAQNQRPIEYSTVQNSILEPGTSPSVLTVGATSVTNGLIRNYSSEGPTIDGRPKPDLYAPDGGQNVTYGQFFGTSASAPTVAGAAALWLSSTYGSGKDGADFMDAFVDHITPVAGVESPKNYSSDAGALSLRGASTFTDVLMTHPFLADIMWMSDQGISTGYDNGTFQPSATVSRQAMAAFMYRFADVDGFIPPPVSPFNDMTPSSPFYAEAAWMADAGISTGYTDGTFRPGASVSRQAMAAFMYRLAGEPAFDVPVSSSFSDVSTESEFYTAIEWMAEAEISTGYTDGTFKPGAAVSRQAMSAFMFRLAQWTELP